MDDSLHGARRLWSREVLPDRHGLLGFALVAGAFISHALVSPRDGFLFSSHVALELAGHLWLLLAPPVGAYLGARRLVRPGPPGPLPYVAVVLGGFLTLLTAVGVGTALLA
jgi:hypothetical protein